MCGISITRRANVIDKIQHRGIEFAQIAEGGWFLGHVRLPIQTEPGDGLAQPIKLAGNNGWLLYVGEIYNYPTRYSSDVEYLRDLFGSSCLEDIIYEANNWDGMWAICWYRKGHIVVFTDPLGKKQLYYNQFGEICSECRTSETSTGTISRKCSNGATTGMTGLRGTTSSVLCRILSIPSMT